MNIEILITLNLAIFHEKYKALAMFYPDSPIRVCTLNIGGICCPPRRKKGTIKFVTIKFSDTFA